MVGRLGSLFAALTALLLLGAAGVGYLFWLFEKPGPLERETVVLVPRGLGLASIADRLEQADVIEDRWLFVAGVTISGHDGGLQAGEFAFPAGVSARDAMAILESGRTVVHTVTVPEGLTSAEVAALIQAEPLLSGEIERVPPEGSLLPETYAFSRGESRQEVIERMQAAMRDAVAKRWADRTDGLPLESAEEAVILASIVEKETGLAGERARVAGVFINRLERGMPLQSDPTVIYALTRGERPLGRELLRSDWQVDAPHNTYRNPGLPPTPIANPGLAALEAVTRPERTDYLYFVADGNGGHAFARTLTEHNRNVARWQRLRREERQLAN